MEKTFVAEEAYERGRAALDEGRPREALEALRVAYELVPESPRIRSFYGLALALAERRFERALELCQRAAKEEFYNPELYLNLARVHLAFGFKAEAIRYLRRGLMIDPAHEPTRAELRRLGERRRPVFPFLPRRHFLNRWSGRLRARLEGFRLPRTRPGVPALESPGHGR